MKPFFLFSRTDLFAFRGSQARSVPSSSIPETIKSWPTLLPDLLAASMSSAQARKSSVMDPAMNDTDSDNLNSILAVSDDLGHIFCFLDGCYPLGALSLGPRVFTSSIYKNPKLSIIYAHPQVCVNDSTLTDLLPATIEIPLLDKRQVRDMAKLSSTARELLWYAMRVVKEMRTAWFGGGGETYSGARELGPKWIRALETKQKEQFGRMC
jgi:anaphase-promoting complex subunit 4